MAKITVKLPDELMRKMDSLGKETDRIVKASLEAGGELIKREALKKYDAISGRPLIIRKNGRLYNYGKRSKGVLRNSIGIAPVKVNSKGEYDIKIGFAKAVEPDTGIRCGYLAAIIERGVLHGARNQPPRPFIKPAERASKQASIDAFQKKFDEEVEKL